MSERLKFLKIVLELADHEAGSEDASNILTDYLSKLNYKQYLQIRDIIYPFKGDVSKQLDKLTLQFKKSIKKYLHKSLIEIIVKFLDISANDIYSALSQYIIQNALDPTYIVFRSDDIDVIKDTVERNRDDIDTSVLEEWLRDNDQSEKWLYFNNLISNGT